MIDNDFLGDSVDLAAGIHISARDSDDAGGARWVRRRLRRRGRRGAPRGRAGQGGLQGYSISLTSSKTNKSKIAKKRFKSPERVKVL